MIEFKWKKYLGGIIVISIIFIYALGFYGLWREGLAYRFIQHDSAGEIASPKNFVSSLENRGPIALAVKSKGIDKANGKEQIIQTLLFVMNSVSTVEREQSNDPNRLYKLATSG